MSVAEGERVTLSETPVPLRQSNTSDSRTRYRIREAHRYVVRVPQPAPVGIRVSLRLQRETDGWWAHIDEIDVSAEGADARAAFEGVLSAARDWLEYLKDEAPALAQPLAPQRAYIELLDAPVFSWFKSINVDAGTP